LGGFIPANSDITFEFVAGEFENLGFVPGSSDITILLDGIYRIDYLIEPIYLGGQTLTIQVNGVDVTSSDRFNEQNGRNSDMSMTVFVSLVAGDIVTFHVAGQEFLNISTADPVANISLERIA
jgi:hypothetical protein